MSWRAMGGAETGVRLVRRGGAHLPARPVRQHADLVKHGGGRVHPARKITRARQTERVRVETSPVNEEGGESRSAPRRLPATRARFGSPLERPEEDVRVPERIDHDEAVVLRVPHDDVCAARRGGGTPRNGERAQPWSAGSANRAAQARLGRDCCRFPAQARGAALGGRLIPAAEPELMSLNTTTTQQCGTDWTQEAHMRPSRRPRHGC